MVDKESNPDPYSDIRPFNDDEIAPVVDTWFLTNPGGSRSWDVQQIQESLLPQALVFPTPELALANAVTRAREGDRVLVTGSFLTVEAVMDSEFLQ